MWCTLWRMALAVPEPQDMTTWDARTLFSADLDGLIDAVWVERERYLRQWVSDGWTQQRIADEVGRSQQVVSKWMARFGIEPVSNQGRPRKIELQPSSNSEPGEVVDAEAVEALIPPCNSSPRPRTIDGIKFPSGGITDDCDVTEYNAGQLKSIARDLIRRASPQEASALHALFTKYALEAKERANGAIKAA